MYFFKKIPLQFIALIVFLLHGQYAVASCQTRSETFALNALNSNAATAAVGDIIGTTTFRGDPLYRTGSSAGSTVACGFITLDWVIPNAATGVTVAIAGTTSRVPTYATGIPGIGYALAANFTVDTSNEPEPNVATTAYFFSNSTSYSTGLSNYSNKDLRYKMTVYLVKTGPIASGPLPFSSITGISIVPHPHPASIYTPKYSTNPVPVKFSFGNIELPSPACEFSVTQQGVMQLPNIPLSKIKSVGAGTYLSNSPSNVAQVSARCPKNLSLYGTVTDTRAEGDSRYYLLNQEGNGYAENVDVLLRVKTPANSSWTTVQTGPRTTSVSNGAPGQFLIRAAAGTSADFEDITTEFQAFYHRTTTDNTIGLVKANAVLTFAFN